MVTTWAQEKAGKHERPQDWIWVVRGRRSQTTLRDPSVPCDTLFPGDTAVASGPHLLNEDTGDANPYFKEFVFKRFDLRGESTQHLPTHGSPPP